MRPDSLYALFASIHTIPGVGPGMGQALQRLGCATPRDLLWHLPSALIERRTPSGVLRAQPGEVVTFLLTVAEHRPPSERWGRGQPYRVRCQDTFGHFLDVVFFRSMGAPIEALLPPGEQRVISGKLEFFNGRLQITHPDHIGPPATFDAWTGAEPAYPLTKGLTQKQLRKFITGALDRTPVLPEWIRPEVLLVRGFKGWRESLLAAHNPTKWGDLDVTAPARARLGYDEILADQLSLGLLRASQTRLGVGRVSQGVLAQKVLDILPFALTDDQIAARAEIRADMARPQRMLRLLQGDVGSGKTVVAFLAALDAIEAGAQAALMVPTEILARQHWATLRPWAEAIGVRCELLLGGASKKDRSSLIEDLKTGAVPLLIGTHALIQDDVIFQNLGLVVIDEHHRFGVEQRLKIAHKGPATDVLAMTATPIPRSLALTQYGELASTLIRQKPAGRQEIQTRVMALSKMDEVSQSLVRAIANGDKIYWICPLIEESEVTDLAAAEDRFAALSVLYPDQVGLVHGRMSAEARDGALQAFIAGNLKVLVATTVIEVGVHVADASIMVIEHAERFGLSQLHQLRGRIGRGARASTCLLLYHPSVSEVGRARLDVMRRTTDGFVIAEEDLRLRGGGELLGTQQSGLPGYTFFDPLQQEAFLEEAHQDVCDILESDPALLSPRGKALRVLLHLFGRADAVRYLEAG